MSVGRKDWVERVLDSASVHYQRQARVQPSMAWCAKGWKIQGTSKGELRIRQHWEWQAEPLNDLTLVVRILT